MENLPLSACVAAGAANSKISAEIADATAPKNLRLLVKPNAIAIHRALHTALRDEAMQMRDRLAAGSLVGDGQACRAYADAMATRLDERLAKEAEH